MKMDFQLTTKIKTSLPAIKSHQEMYTVSDLVNRKEEYYRNLNDQFKMEFGAVFYECQDEDSMFMRKMNADIINNRHVFLELYLDKFNQGKIDKKSLARIYCKEIKSPYHCVKRSIGSIKIRQFAKQSQNDTKREDQTKISCRPRCGARRRLF